MPGHPRDQDARVEVAASIVQPAIAPTPIAPTPIAPTPIAAAAIATAAAAIHRKVRNRSTDELIIKYHQPGIVNRSPTYCQPPVSHSCTPQNDTPVAARVKNRTTKFTPRPRHRAGQQPIQRRRVFGSENIGPPQLRHCSDRDVVRLPRPQEPAPAQPPGTVPYGRKSFKNGTSTRSPNATPSTTAKSSNGNHVSAATNAATRPARKRVPCAS